MSSPHKRYMQRMVLASIFYIGTLMIAAFMHDEGDPVTPLTVILAILPGLGVIGYLWAIGRLIIEQKDEFIRMLIVRQCLYGIGIALSAAAVHGFLSSFDVVPRIDAFWWPVVFFLGFGVGGVINKMQFGASGECA
ncbi:hypothetical protein [Sphingomicrobium arenosum]|uniref:hypothetical protein n=1 Tax=Sphingomicrobium arenosum TaxID=2233861 RepID=UPI002241012D|nr:hypothetical protein [Sphingomicrobium arenosum]